MMHAELVGLRSRMPEKTFEETLVTIGDSLSHLPSSKDGDDGEDEDDEDTKYGKLSEDDEPGWVMAIFSTTVQQPMEMFRKKQMKFNELTHAA
jgi:hypothetical protein